MESIFKNKKRDVRALLRRGYCCVECNREGDEKDVVDFNKRGEVLFTFGKNDVIENAVYLSDFVEWEGLGVRHVKAWVAEAKKLAKGKVIYSGYLGGTGGNELCYVQVYEED